MNFTPHELRIFAHLNKVWNSDRTVQLYAAHWNDHWNGYAVSQPDQSLEDDGMVRFFEAPEALLVAFYRMEDDERLSIAAQYTGYKARLKQGARIAAAIER